MSEEMQPCGQRFNLNLENVLMFIVSLTYGSFFVNEYRSACSQRLSASYTNIFILHYKRHIQVIHSIPHSNPLSISFLSLANIFK